MSIRRAQTFPGPRLRALTEVQTITGQPPDHPSTAEDPDNGSGPPSPRKGGIAHKVVLNAARVVPIRVQRLLKKGPVGNAMRFVMDKAAPAGRREVLPVSSGLLKGTLLDVDPRKQRDMIAGTYESEVQNALAKHLKPGQIAFDVGAHLGFFTLLMARLVGDGGTVVSVEPDPFMAPKLEANLKSNHAGNVQVVRKAAGTQDEERRFTPGAGGGIGHLADDGEIEVSATSLNRLAAQFGVPNLVKVDVEGGELEVLAGAGDLLSSNKCTFVVEVHDGQIQSEAEALFNRMDYQVSFIQDNPSQRLHLIASPPNPSD